MRKILLYFVYSFGLGIFLLTNAANANAQVCERDPYQGRPTICSLSNSGRMVVPGFSGCGVGQFCVISQGITCEGKEGQINTAIGCIPTFDVSELSAFILRWAIGIGGGIAFLLMVYAGFMIMSSAGNPERLKAGQELLTSSIAGIIMLIFSVFVLRVIGVDILQIPGFGS